MEALKSMTVPQLESLLENYPWFTAARSEYFSRCRETMDEDAFRRAVARVGVYLISRGDFLKIVSGKEEVKEAPVEETPAKPSYYVVGGDYFSKEDFSELEQSGQAIETPVFNPIGLTLDMVQSPAELSVERKEYSEDDFLTETLATVYADQEFYTRAIEIYEKLILLYPEKSAYFATLIEKVNNINK